MEWYFVALGIVTLLTVLIAIGLPIPFALVAASVPFLWGIQSFSTSLMSAELMLWGSWINYILVAVPIFILLGEIVGRSEIGPRLFRVLHGDIPFRGSAAYGTVAACAGFGAVSGSSMIGALTIGTVALPEMLKLGYGKRLSAGVVAAGGTLSVLIPPSLILLFYGIVTDVSIGRLFLAGAVPGVVLALMFCVVIFVWALVQPGAVPKKGQYIRSTILVTALGLFPIVIISAVIVGSIYFGIATPTEAAAVATLVTIALAFWIGRLTLRGLFEAIMATLRTMGYLGLLFSGAILLGFVLNYHEIPQNITQIVNHIELSPAAVLLLVIAFYLLLGMFLEPASITFITLPTVFPVVTAAGFDLLWFGVIFTITMEIAALTPPVGLNLYVLESLAPKDNPIKIVQVFLGSLPFIAAMLVLIVLLIIFPQIALWLPELML